MAWSYFFIFLGSSFHHTLLIDLRNVQLLLPLPDFKPHFYLGIRDFLPPSTRERTGKGCLVRSFSKRDFLQHFSITAIISSCGSKGLSRSDNDASENERTVVAARQKLRITLLCFFLRRALRCFPLILSSLSSIEISWFMCLSFPFGQDN